MNKVMLIGRFTRDPESRMTQSNMEVSRFFLACSSDFVNRNGEKETEFINCVAFNRTASTINRYCKKGQLISVTGRIRNSSYDAQDGTKRYTTDVVVDNFEFLPLSLIPVYSDTRRSEQLFSWAKTQGKSAKSKEKALKIRVKSDFVRTIIKPFFDL